MNGKILLEPLVIKAIYVFTIFNAISQLRLQLYQQRIWRVMYSGSSVIMVSLCILFLLVQYLRGQTKYDLFEILTVLFIFYEMFVSYWNGLFYPTSILIDVITWPLLLLVFYRYSRYFEHDKSMRGITAVGMFILCILSIPNIQRHLIDYGRRGGVIFPVYYCITFLPLVLYFCSKKVQLFFMSLSCVLLLISTKRTGAAALIIGIVLFFYIEAKIQGTANERLKKYSKYLIIGLILLAVGWKFINSHDIAIVERFSRIAEDGGSNRVYIWKDVMDHYHASSMSNKLFGHGFHAVYYRVQPYGFQRMAHNSFMETLYDYGIVGLTLLISLLLYIFKNGVAMIKDKVSYAPVLAYTFIPTIFLGVFSYLFEQNVVIAPLALLWGIIVGNYIKDKTEC